MKGSAYEGLAGQLFNETLSLQVSPRRRFIVTTSLLVPATGSSSLITSFTPAVADILQTNDGLYFDKVTVWLSAPSAGLTASQIEAFLQDTRGFQIPLGQPVATQSAVSPVGFTAFDFAVTPPLLTSFDLNSILGTAAGAPGQGPEPLTAQPVQLRLAILAANSTAAAITLTIAAAIWLRYVQGLQEN